MPLVEVARDHDRAPIHIMRSVLADAGIDSFIFDQEVVLYAPARLMVLDQDAAAARRLLEAMA